MSSTKMLPQKVAQNILFHLEEIPPNDRLGFLFGILVASLQAQGFTRDAIIQELKNGVDIVYEGLSVLEKLEPAKD